MSQIELEAIWQAAMQQQIFRQLLSCASLPGTIADLSELLGQQRALIGLLATLLDHTTPLHDVDGLVSERDHHLLAAPDSPLAEARFIVANAATAPKPEFRPPLGTLSSPELGATLILQGHSLGIGQLTLKLTGPGISGQHIVALAGFDGTWFDRRAEWLTSFPLGVDLILVDAARVMVLPRTTQIEMTVERFLGHS